MAKKVYHRKVKKDHSKAMGIFISLFIVIIMFLSMFGYFSGSIASQKIKYNNFKFKVSEDPQGYKLKYDGDYKYLFNYLPQDLESLDISSLSDYLINSNVLNLASANDLNDSEAMLFFDYARFILSDQDNVVVSGVSYFNDTNNKLPFMDCSMAGPGNVLFVFDKMSDASTLEIVKEAEYCYSVKASKFDYLKVAEKMKYLVLGVMN
jgi:hypothetical protein